MSERYGTACFSPTGQLFRFLVHVSLNFGLIDVESIDLYTDKPNAILASAWARQEVRKRKLQARSRIGVQWRVF